MEKMLNSSELADCLILAKGVEFRVNRHLNSIRLSSHKTGNSYFDIGNHIQPKSNATDGKGLRSVVSSMDSSTLDLPSNVGNWNPFKPLAMYGNR